MTAADHANELRLYELAAAEYIAEHGTDALVAELRLRIAAGRRIKLGTTNTLILLAHIDRLETER